MMRLLALLLILVVAGCAVREAPRETQATVEPVFQNPAVIALLEEAERQQSAGRLDLASNAIERALRIDPQDPLLRVRLGWLRLEQGDPFQAKSLARMAVVYAGDARRDVQADAWDLIAEAERSIGNQVEATLAEQEAAQLRKR